MRVVFVHGACVRDGSWWWHPTAAILAERGIISVAPALPSCGEGGLSSDGLSSDRLSSGGLSSSDLSSGGLSSGGLSSADLYQDVAAVRAVLEASDEPTVIVGHSYGGIVAAEAAVGAQSVRHMVFVSSYLPLPGESLSTFGAPEPPPFLDFDPEGGTFGGVPELFAETFVQDCPPEIIKAALERLTRQNIAVLQQPVQAAAWPDRPNTYVVCTEDNGTPATAQREFARRADKVLELKSGHHPFLSQPEAVADIITAIANR
ncbi:alpha/beta hydrolase [Actinoplanes couchii]|uniref:AB hydrolase-1 domain-containing protein n=2 Tax=Actinoplanes couchii TaxID=403638 RepID=A0ABQ3XMJ0_9ACTN|nr:hypothetical protein Aco03nite_081200 [Actinoplanes couchii]